MFSVAALLVVYTWLKLSKELVLEGKERHINDMRAEPFVLELASCVATTIVEGTLDGEDS